MYRRSRAAGFGPHTQGLADIARHVIQCILDPRFPELHGILCYDVGDNIGQALP
jgi:hypothetical protein